MNLQNSNINALAEMDEIFSPEDLVWGSPKDLPTTLPVAEMMTPELAKEMLPEPIYPWILDVAKRLQVPIEMVAGPAIGALSSIIGRRIAIKPKRYDDWIVPAVLWTAIIARPGQKKSPVLRAVLSPIEKIQEKYLGEYNEKLPEFIAEQKIKKDTIESYRTEFKKNLKKNGTNEEIKNKIAQAERDLLNSEISMKRLITNDCTVEKVAELLKFNSDGLLLSRDELFGWLNKLNSFGHEGDREFYLEAWNGLGAFNVDRIGRGSLHIPALCISIMGGLQPDKLQKYLKKITTNEISDDGLLQRFQILIYPEKLKTYKYIDEFPDQEAKDRVFKIFNNIAELKTKYKTASYSDKYGISFIHFENDAQELFDEWLKGLEIRLHTEDQLEPIFESHLNKYRSLMPIISLIFHLIEWGDDLTSHSGVKIGSAKKAAAWCDFLESHARKAYSFVLNRDLYGAYALAKKIKLKEINSGDSIRSIYRHHWSFLSSAEEVEAAIAVLEKSNWVQIQSVKTIGAPREVLLINPAILSETGDVSKI